MWLYIYEGSTPHTCTVRRLWCRVVTTNWPRADLGCARAAQWADREPSCCCGVEAPTPAGGCRDGPCFVRCGDQRNRGCRGESACPPSHGFSPSAGRSGNVSCNADDRTGRDNRRDDCDRGASILSSTARRPAKTVPSTLPKRPKPPLTTKRSAAFPQVTFPEATVRDPETEAADRERRQSVIGLFERLRVQAEHRTGYDREAVFDGWLYSGGQSTRDRVLASEQLPDGTWFSTYDSVVVLAAADLDIDHIVPLAEAWESGGHAWSADTWTRFGNDLHDPRSLIAVSASTNRSKGARDPQDWWPPESGYRCQYAADWIAVKTRWKLTMDAAEQRSIDAQLESCSGAEFVFNTPVAASVTFAEPPLRHPRTNPLPLLSPTQSKRPPRSPATTATRPTNRACRICRATRSTAAISPPGRSRCVSKRSAWTPTV